MTTADKRKLFTKKYRNEWFSTLLNIENGEYREVDNIAQGINSPAALQYIITLLCDELIVEAHQ